MKEHVVFMIKDEDKKFLFVKRSAKKSTLPNIWAFPSGTRKEEETFQETAEREAMEELGVKVNTKEVMGTKEISKFNVNLIFLVCTIASGEPTIEEPDEIDKIEWMTFSEFFDRFDDSEIGHGLIFLRQNPEIWKNYKD